MIFTPEQQAKHCRELADKLENDPRVHKHYDHYAFRRQGACGTVACALGWAATLGIGGLGFDGVFPTLPSLHCAVDSANTVFGPGAYHRIFAGYNRVSVDGGEADRCAAIERLRNQAALLETQPELA